VDFLSGDIKTAVILSEQEIKSNEYCVRNSFDDFNDYITNEPTIGSNVTALFVFGFYSKAY